MVLIFHSFKGFSDLRQTFRKTLGRLLDFFRSESDFSEDSWKTLRRILEDFRKSFEVFCPKWYKGMMSSGV
ncbi:hypothetical protein F2Q70_00031353 [Brassica cretica]|uniref:Uncharacterized protein n=1 Tax=Brassica cretica TaxID=69181 RepID=A0A8S9FIS8_BRACR|nr:hypothetical protein F2Q70_00031353 [Brassica cretica]